MKTQSFIFSICLFLLGLTACNSGSSVMTRATGIPYEAVVVMDKANWESTAGTAIKNELLSDLPGLPNSEPSIKITYVTPTEFNGLLTYVRNIVIITIDPSMYTRVSVNAEINRWANGQIVVNINAPDGDVLRDYLDRNPRSIVGIITKAEMNRTIAQLEKTYSTVVLDNVRSKFGATLKVPSDMTYIRNATDFFWASNNANRGRTDVIVYTFPYTDPETFTLNYLIAKRDSVLRENLPGSFENSYMTTETRWGLEYTLITVQGKYCAEIRGLWKMVGDMMGGPFVSHVRLDEANNQVIVVEGFVFAPETDKRNYIRRIEAALYTLLLLGDHEAPEVK